MPTRLPIDDVRASRWDGQEGRGGASLPHLILRLLAGGAEVDADLKAFLSAASGSETQTWVTAPVVAPS